MGISINSFRVLTLKGRKLRREIIGQQLSFDGESIFVGNRVFEGMGEVYLADDLNLNCKVALKFLPDAFTSDPERMARFEREAKLLGDTQSSQHRCDLQA